ncbi:MAG: BatD family protein [Chitinophagaceae bacterium]
MVRSFLFFAVFFLIFATPSDAQVSRIQLSGTNSVVDESLISGDYILRGNESAKDKIPNNIFVRLELNKKRCYVGEPVIATFKLYTRLKSESRIIKRPSFNGFSVYDMVEPESTTSRTEYFRGKPYSVYILRKVQLYALQPGSFKIDPMEVENVVSFIKIAKREKKGSQQYVDYGFGDMTFSQQSMVSDTVVTASISDFISVKPLPQPLPNDFNGSVGTFNINAKVQEDSIHMNDLVHVKIQISGKGNFPVINAPSIEWGSDFDAFDPELMEKYDLTACPISGAKIYTVPFIPKKTGMIKLPKIALWFFDPERKSFKRDTAKVLYINVLPEANNIQTENLDKDKNKSGLSYIFWWVSLFSTLILGVYFFSTKRKEKRVSKNKVPVEMTGPVLFIEENIDLDRLKKLMERNDAKGFYKYAGELIDDHLHLKLGMDLSGDWKSILKNSKEGKRDLSELIVLRERIDGILYAPIAVEADMQIDYQIILRFLKA